MSEKYQVKCIYEVYSPYRIKICGHLAYLSFTLGVLDTLTSNIYMSVGTGGGGAGGGGGHLPPNILPTQKIQDCKNNDI